jgi:hypothetical protein
MIIRNLFLVLLFTTGIVGMAFSQGIKSNKLVEAIKASKVAKKPLIIFRINNTVISFTPGNDDRSRAVVDSAIHASAFMEPFKKGYLIYYHDESQASAEDKLYLTQYFLKDDSPNLIILNDKEESIAYITLKPGILNDDFFAYTQNKIKEFEPQVKAIQELEAKFKAKNISGPELEELIRTRYQLRKASLIHWNSLASQKEQIPAGTEFRLLTKESFTKEDAFYKYLMNTEDSDLKIELLQNLKQRAIADANVEGYLALKSTCDSIRYLSLYGKSNPPKHTITNIPAEKKYEGEETMKLVELYTKSGNESMLVKSATMFARNLMTNPTPKDSKPVIIAGSDKNDIFGNITVTGADGDTLNVKSSEDYNGTGSNPLSISSLHAIYLSHIAWSFAEVVKEKSNLLEAIVWCKKSIELYPGKENNHVIAQLYYATGKPQKAIEHQKKAITLAVADGLTPKQIQFYRDTLLKFESE